VWNLLHNLAFFVGKECKCIAGAFWAITEAFLCMCLRDARQSNSPGSCYWEVSISTLFKSPNLLDFSTCWTFLPQIVESCPGIHQSTLKLKFTISEYLSIVIRKISRIYPIRPSISSRFLHPLNLRVTALSLSRLDCLVDMMWWTWDDCARLELSHAWELISPVRFFLISVFFLMIFCTIWGHYVPFKNSSAYLVLAS